jgi:hypothetical protein
MSEGHTADTSTAPDVNPRNEFVGLGRSLATAVFGFKFVAASTEGIRQCFSERSCSTQIRISDLAETCRSSATQIGVNELAESSTQIREMTSEIQARLDATLDAARREIIEDGMRNAINLRLPGLIARDFSAVIPALISVIEAGHTTPMVAAEVLKELGRMQHGVSHASRLWVLERALSLPSPFIRDGAGLGLAALADRAALPYLQKAVESEPNAQIRTDLQLVINELNEM